MNYKKAVKSLSVSSRGNSNKQKMKMSASVDNYCIVCPNAVFINLAVIIDSKSWKIYENKWQKIYIQNIFRVWLLLELPYSVRFKIIIGDSKPQLIFWISNVCLLFITIFCIWTLYSVFEKKPVFVQFIGYQYCSCLLLFNNGWKHLSNYCKL